MKRSESRDSSIVLDLMLATVQALTKRGVKQTAALVIGQEIITLLSSMSGGVRYTVPKNINVKEDYARKIALIHEDLTSGDKSNRDLALKHGLTELRIGLLKRMKDEPLRVKQLGPETMDLKASLVQYLPQKFQRVAFMVGIENANKILNTFAGATLYLGNTSEHTKDTELLSVCIGEEAARMFVGHCQIGIPSKRTFEAALRKHQIIEGYKTGKTYRELMAITGVRAALVHKYTKDIRAASNDMALAVDLKSAQDTFDKTKFSDREIEVDLALTESIVRWLPNGAFRKAIPLIGIENAEKMLNSFTGQSIYVGNISGSNICEKKYTAGIKKIAALIGVDTAAKLYGLRFIHLPSRKTFECAERKQQIIEAFESGQSVEEIATSYILTRQPLCNKIYYVQNLIHWVALDHSGDDMVWAPKGFPTGRLSRSILKGGHND